MKSLLALLCSVITLAGSPVNNGLIATEDGPYFTVEVVQDGAVVSAVNGQFKLQKKPFKLQLKYFKTDHIFVSASWGTYYYDYPSDENIFLCEDDRFLEDCRFVSIKTGNEDRFNVNKDLYVGDGDYQSVWFYLEEIDWYRMDKGVQVIDGVIHAEVTVEKIYDMDRRDSREYTEAEYIFPVQAIDRDIYLVFATEHYEKGMEYPEELQREKFVLTFE